MSNQQSQESFRLLIKEIVVDEITHEKLNLLHWHLKLPLRLLDDSTPSMAILRSLEERRIMFKWSKEPETLIDILQQIGRDDLAVKVQEWLDKQLEPEEHISQQETACEEDISIDKAAMPILKTRQARRSQRGRCTKMETLESVEEHSDEEKEAIVIKSGMIGNDHMYFLTDFEIQEKNRQRVRAGSEIQSECHDRTASMASSGYFSDTASQRFSGLSLSDTLFAGQESLSQKRQSVDYKQIVDSSTLNPFSGEEQGSRNIDVTDTDKLGCRPRSKSLGNAKAARAQVNRKLHKDIETASTSSLKSETSELTSLSSVSSQRSVLSEDQSTTDQDSSGGSTRGSQESVKANSLRRANTISCICITGQINIPLRKVKEDISEGKSLPRTSDPFPCLKDIQYQLRFFSCNFSKKYCALYLDVAPKYLNKQMKRSSAVSIKIPDMEVSVDVNICCYLGQKHKVTTEFERVKSTIVDRSHIQKQSNVVICSFPNLIKLEELTEYLEDRKCTSDIVIEVHLKCV